MRFKIGNKIISLKHTNENISQDKIDNNEIIELKLFDEYVETV